MGENDLVSPAPERSTSKPLIWVVGSPGTDAKSVARDLVEMLRDRTDAVVFPVYLDARLVQWIAGDEKSPSAALPAEGERCLARLAYAMWRLGHWVVCAGSTEGLASSRKWLEASTAARALLFVWLSTDGRAPRNMDIVLTTEGQKTPTEVLANKIVERVLAGETP